MGGSSVLMSSLHPQTTNNESKPKSCHQQHRPLTMSEPRIDLPSQRRTTLSCPSLHLTHSLTHSPLQLQQQRWWSCTWSSPFPSLSLPWEKQKRWPLTDLPASNEVHRQLLMVELGDEKVDGMEMESCVDVAAAAAAPAVSTGFLERLRPRCMCRSQYFWSGTTSLEHRHFLPSVRLHRPGSGSMLFR